MNPTELKQAEYTDAEKQKVEVKVEEPGTLAKVSSTGPSSDQWRQIGERISLFLSDLPEFLTDFFGEYKRPLLTVGLIFGGLVSVKLTLAILSAINDIPLLAPTFELVGIGYTAWFVYRYLLRASDRQELSQEIDTLKQQVVGNVSSKS